MKSLSKIWKSLFGPFPKFKLGEVVNVNGIYYMNREVEEVVIVSIDDTNGDVTYSVKYEVDDHIYYVSPICEKDINDKRLDRVKKLNKLLYGK